MNEKILIIGSNSTTKVIGKLLGELNYEVVIAKQNYDFHEQKSKLTQFDSLDRYREENETSANKKITIYANAEDFKETFRIVVIAEKSERVPLIINNAYAHLIEESLIVCVDPDDKLFEDNNLSQNYRQKSKVADRRYLEDINSQAIVPLLKGCRFFANINITYLQDTLKIIRSLQDLKSKSKTVWRASD